MNKIETSIREYAEELPVSIKTDDDNRWILEAFNEAGYNGVDIDLEDVLLWVKTYMPELWQSI